MMIIIVLHMPRQGSSCRIMPHVEAGGYNLLRGASDLYPRNPPFKGLNALIMPKRDLQVLPSESRVRVVTSAAGWLPE